MKRQIKYRINTKPILPSSILSPHHLQHSRGQELRRRRSSWLAPRFLQREQRQLSIRIRRSIRGSVFLLPDSSLMLRLSSEPARFRVPTPDRANANVPTSGQLLPHRQQTNTSLTPAHQYQARKHHPQITSNDPRAHTINGDRPPTVRARGLVTPRS